MIGGLIEGAALGAVFQEAAKPFTNQISKAWNFKTTRENLKYLVDLVMPVAEETKLLNEKSNRSNVEIDILIDELKQGRELVNKYSNVPWQKFFLLSIYQGELHAMGERISRSITLVNAIIMGRDVKEILYRMEDMQGRQFNAPVKPDFTVGLDVPLRELKKWVLSSDVSVDSVHVLTGLAGSGKTTLATLLCWDDKVIGKFGENILFIPVAKNPDLKNIVQTLFKHCGHKKPYLVDHDDAVKNLRCLLNKIGGSCPLMLVLDNVFQDSESFVNAFKVQLPYYKILITSRVKFPRFRTSLFLKPLRDEDAVIVFRHFALPNDGTIGSYVPDEDDVQQIAKGCWGSPLALESIGGSLNGQHIEAWKEMVNMLSKGGSIVDSNDELRDGLQKVLENALQDNHIIKECFMDLGLFFEDKKIPVAALIDMWTELYDLDDDDIKGMNIVHKLTNRHLVKLVVSREVTTHVDHYYNHHFLTQHDLLKEIAVHQARQEPFELRKRLIFDVNENSWDQQNQQNAIARTLSIYSDKMVTPDWSNVEQVEVLILNLLTDKYTLPECLKRMTKLKVLIITNYKGFQCAELDNFEILGCLPNLRRIRLQQVSVPSLCKLVNLRKLSLYFCETKQIFQSNTVSISDKLPNLEELCVDYCKDLVTLPSGLCDIISLKKLSITRCINFLSLPQEIGNLENLKVLRLSSCAELGEIPASIEKLLKLHFLDISGCASLHNLPEEIGNLHNLKELHMTGFSLDTLPGSVTKLENLKHLICDQETAVCWEHFKPSLPNLKIEEAAVNLFIIV